MTKRDLQENAPRRTPLAAPAIASLLVAGAMLLLPCADADAAIRWRNPQAGAPPIADAPAAVDVAPARLRELVPPAAKRRVIVQFDRPMDQPGRAALAAHGLTLLAPLGDHAFFAQADGARLDVATLAQHGLILADAIRPTHKLDPRLVNAAPEPFAVVGQASDHAGRAQPVTAVYVLLHPDADMTEAKAAIEATGAVVSTDLTPVKALVVHVRQDRLEALAAVGDVQWIEHSLPPLTDTNNENRAATQVNTVQAAPYGLDGTGVTVMIFDGGDAFAGHADFEGRLTVNDSDSTSNHATHVAGTVGAGGDMHRGMAPNVTLESYGFEYTGGNSDDNFFLYSDPGDIINDYAHAINVRGAVIANNSIGSNISQNGFNCEWTGNYGVTSIIIDSIVRGVTGQPMKIVWANGNERGGWQDCGMVDKNENQTYYTTAPPATAKNHLTVGALNANDDSVTDFTSWGPTDDGRLKPDVAAPGCEQGNDGGVTSLSSGGGYTTMCGTSMAAPTVTGCAALLIQDFRTQFPSAPEMSQALMKALFIHTAQDIQNPGPDYQTGYGKVQVQEAIDFMRTGRFLEAAVGQDDVYQATINVPPTGGDVKATLVWADPPGTPNVETVLVNDLDLLVTGPGGAAFPLTLDPAEPAAPAAAVGPDRLNNVEQVRIPAAAPGLYTVTVTGFNVPEGPQAFALTLSPSVVQTDIALVEGPGAFTAPGEPIPVQAQVTPVGEEVVPGSVELLYRTDDASEFTTLTMSPLDGGLYEATIPALSCSDDLDFYVQAAGSINGFATSPGNAPSGTHTAQMGEPVASFSDNFEQDLGWTVENVGGLADGAWTVGVPAGAGDRGDPVLDADGSGQCWLTDNQAGNSDVDDGTTILTSPTLDASDPQAILSYWRWYSNAYGDAPLADVFTVEVSDDDGATWTVLEEVGPGGNEVAGGWFQRSWTIGEISGIEPSAAFRIRFLASDLGNGSIVEAGVDAVSITAVDCEDVKLPCEADIASPTDGIVGVGDLLTLLAAWGTNDPAADLTGDGDVGVSDLLGLLEAWGECP